MQQGKRIYLSTFISGVSEVIADNFNKLVTDGEIELLLDGVVVYKTSLDSKELAKLRFFNNTFLLLDYWQNKDINYAINTFTRNPHIPDLPANTFRSFRLVFSIENQIKGVSPQVREKLEYQFSNKLHLKVNRNKPDTEIWFYERSEKYTFVLLRITNYSFVEHRLKGELRPEIGYVMSLISDVSKEDVVIDPFAGYGSILEERAKFPYTSLTGIEIDSNTFQTLRNKTGKIKRIQLLREDFLKSKLEYSAFNKVITDPPWGFYEKLSADFYPKLVKKSFDILAKDGLAVVLVSRDKETEVTGEFTKHFTKEKCFNILVSGKKASILKFRKS